MVLRNKHYQFSWHSRIKCKLNLGQDSTEKLTITKGIKRDQNVIQICFITLQVQARLKAHNYIIFNA